MTAKVSFWDALRSYLLPTNPDEGIKRLFLFILLFEIAFVLVFAHLWEPISDTDALVYWTVSKNAAEHGNWLPLRFSALWYPEFYEHPPLFFWMQALLFKVVGSGLPQSKILPGLLGLGLVLLVFQIGRRFGGDWVGFFAGLCLLASPRFTAMASKPRLDLPLAFFITLAIWGMLQIEKKKLLPWLVVGLSTGAALLTRGPVGLAPLVTLFIWMLLTGQSRFLTDSRWYLTGILALLPFLAWIAIDSRRVIDGYLLHQVINTMTTGSNKIKTGPLFYVNTLLIFYLPWLPLCAFGCWIALKKKLLQPKLILFLLNAIVIIVGVSISYGKSRHYLFPIYPSLAIFTGIGIAYLTSERIKRYLGNVLIVFLVIYIAVLIGAPVKLHSSPAQPLWQLLPYIDRYVAPGDTVLLVGSDKWLSEPIFQITAYTGREAFWVNISNFRKMELDASTPILLMDSAVEEKISDKLPQVSKSVQSGNLILFCDSLPPGRFDLESPNP